MSRAKNSFRVKAYDVPLNRFANVALPQFLQQLKQHQDNLTKSKENQDWNKVRIELFKGNTTVSHLESAVQELEGVGQNLGLEDRREFEDSFKSYKNQALSAINNFKKHTSEVANPLSHIEESEETNQLQLLQAQVLLQEEDELEERAAQLESVENLQKDIEELQELFTEFSQQVHVQGSTVSNIEENVETALVNVQEGQSHLAKAAKFKGALYPITGALIGTCIGGPVGLLAGLKIGGLAALGGTILGFAGGKGLKKLQENAINDSAADNLTKSQSVPAHLGKVHGELDTLPHSASFRQPPSRLSPTEPSPSGNNI